MHDGSWLALEVVEVVDSDIARGNLQPLLIHGRYEQILGEATRDQRVLQEKYGDERITIYPPVDKSLKQIRCDASIRRLFSFFAQQPQGVKGCLTLQGEPELKIMVTRGESNGPHFSL